MLFCNCALVSQFYMWSLVLSHSLSLFILFFHSSRRTFTETFLFLHIPYYYLLFLFTCVFFFSRPILFSHIKKWWSIICIRSHCTNLGKGKTNESEPRRAQYSVYTYIQTHCAHNKSQRSKRRHRHLAAFTAESFLVYGPLNEITNSASVCFRALSR